MTLQILSDIQRTGSDAGDEFGIEKERCQGKQGIGQEVKSRRRPAAAAPNIGRRCRGSTDARDVCRVCCQPESLKSNNAAVALGWDKVPL